MKKIHLVSLMACALLLIVSCFSKDENNPTSKLRYDDVKTETGQNGNQENVRPQPKTPVANSLPKLNSQEQTRYEANSKKAVEFLFGFTAIDDTEYELIDALNELGLKPEIGVDTNEDTGSMKMIRSQNQIPGLRYFHAQYFSNEDNGFSPQHMSFEMPPAAGNFQMAADLVKKQFEIDYAPKYVKDNYIHWELDDGRTVYITILDKFLMEDNPWNAYDYEKDLGTVKVTVELDPHHGLDDHGGEDEHSSNEHGH